MGDSSQAKQALGPLQWIHETVAQWDADKARIVGGAPRGSLPEGIDAQGEGELLPDDWWRVEHEGRTVGYGRMDVTWGDAEILLVVEPQAQHRGVGSFILENLEAEAQEERAEIITTFYTITSKLESPPLQTVRK